MPLAGARVRAAIALRSPPGREQLIADSKSLTRVLPHADAACDEATRFVAQTDLLLIYLITPGPSPYL